MIEAHGPVVSFFHVGQSNVLNIRGGVRAPVWEGRAGLPLLF